VTRKPNEIGTTVTNGSIIPTITSHTYTLPTEELKNGHNWKKVNNGKGLYI